MAQLATAWKPPRPQPEILPATVGQAAEYMAWFVNRRAYTRQTDRPDGHSGKYYFYQAQDRRTKEPMSLDPLVIQKAPCRGADGRPLRHQSGDAMLEMGGD